MVGLKCRSGGHHYRIGKCPGNVVQATTLTASGDRPGADDGGGAGRRRWARDEADPGEASCQLYSRIMKTLRQHAVPTS